MSLIEFPKLQERDVWLGAFVVLCLCDRDEGVPDHGGIGQLAEAADDVVKEYKKRYEFDGPREMATEK